MQLYKSNAALQDYLKGKEVADVLADFASPRSSRVGNSSEGGAGDGGRLGAREVLGGMRALMPRYYSMSSTSVVVST